MLRLHFGEFSPAHGDLSNNIHKDETLTQHSDVWRGRAAEAQREEAGLGELWLNSGLPVLAHCWTFA